MFRFVHIKDYFAVQYLQRSAHGKSSFDWLFSLHIQVRWTQMTGYMLVKMHYKSNKGKLEHLMLRHNLGIH